jgi:KaiC/GvpD/RAD55 family RecA-like ATPase
MVEKQKDKTRIKLIDLLKSNAEGLTITEVMQKTSLARHTVLARLYNLIGEGKIHVRQINMAKLHYWKEHPATEKELKESMKKGEKVQLVQISEEHIKPAKKKDSDKKLNEKRSGKIDIASIKAEIDGELQKGKIDKKGAQILEQRKPIKGVIGTSHEKTHKEIGKGKHFVKTGIEGFDELLDKGIPKGKAILVAGGAGSGKTIFCLQTIAHHASHGEKCFYMSFEESEEELREHMIDFGWNPKELEKKGNLRIQKFNPFDITRKVHGLLLKQKGELMIDIDPIIIPKDYKPDFFIIDSLTAIASAFVGKENSYRIYIEQLFSFIKKLGATSFLITETEQIPKIFSTTGVEEFLADGVVVFYNLKHGNVRENAIEILKLRGASHQKKIVAMQITGEGIVVYPEQEVFSEIE